jgi:hypothetical protein
MDPGLAVVSIVQAISSVLGVGIVGWTIVAFTRARHGRGSKELAPDLTSLRVLEQRMEQRMERLEQATDSIALQVERIAEGQRFVTKLLSDAEQAHARLPAP